MNILILGGTPSHRGGIEQFCERAQQALHEIGGHHAEYAYSYGPYLRDRGLVPFLRGIWAIATHRSQWDCIWLQYGSLPDLLLLVICRLLRFRVLVTPHVGSNFASQSSIVMRFLSKSLLSTANGIGLLSVSQAEELTLPESPPRFKIFTFLPRTFPAEPPPRRRRAETRRMRLVHAGRLSKGKGSFLFIDVCAILQRSGFAFDAELIGPCPEATRQELGSAISLAGLTGRVDVIGLLPEAELLDRLALADVLVHLSEVDSFPLIVLESIGCGTFPICRNLPGARQMARTYCGQMVEGTDLAEQVARLIIGAEPGHFGRLAASASVDLRRDFDWSSCVAAVEHALSQLPQESRTPRRGRLLDVR